MKRFHVAQIAGSQRKSEGAFGGAKRDRVSHAAVIGNESVKVAVSLPELEKFDDANKVQVYLTPEYKQWFGVIATVEHRSQSQQGRKLFMDWIDEWKREHPAVVAKYDAAIKAAVAEEVAA